MPISVIVPAYNEEAEIADLLRRFAEIPDVSVIVAANGCRDDTAVIARRFPVQVIELAQASKTAALNAADALAGPGPRIYWDADIAPTRALLTALAAAVGGPGVRAAGPRTEIVLTSRSILVRAYYAINKRLPVFEGRLFGRGVIAISADARARFGDFPPIVADDMFLDALFRPEERGHVDETVLVPAPVGVGDLVRRLARSRSGNAEFRAWLRDHGAEIGLTENATPQEERSSWLRDVVLPSPKLWPAAVCYVGITVAAELRRRMPGWSVQSGWGRSRPEAA